MVAGVEVFAAKFAQFQNRYVVIGGAASTLLMEERGLQFRATRDLDIVLVIEEFDRPFASAFWAFVEEAGYSHRQRTTGRPVFYRFEGPLREGYPLMLELFSRVPDSLAIADPSRLTPIPAGGDIASLSAILLDPVYYEFIRAGRILVRGLSIVGPERLIPLKARAYLDMLERRALGVHVDEHDIRKHRNDVVRLYTILDPASPVRVPPVIAGDLTRFLSIFDQDESVRPEILGARAASREVISQDLRRAFQLI